MTFEAVVEELLAHMTGGVDQPPRPARVVVFEVDPRDTAARPSVARSELSSVAAYGPRLDALLAAGAGSRNATARRDLLHAGP